MHISVLISMPPHSGLFLCDISYTHILLVPPFSICSLLLVSPSLHLPYDPPCSLILVLGFYTLPVLCFLTSNLYLALEGGKFVMLLLIHLILLHFLLSLFSFSTQLSFRGCFPFLPSFITSSYHPLCVS